jgi:hypothetical protein
VISDATLRAHLLSTFHGLRNSNDGWVPTSDMNLGGMEAVRLDRIRTVCEQLADAGLIKFKPLPDSDSGSSIVGVSKITGHGSDVVEGQAKPAIAIEFSRSTNVSNRQEEPVTKTSVASPPACVPVKRTEDSTGSYLPNVADKKAPEEPAAELFSFKLTLWGMSVDLKEAHRRIRRRLRKGR